VIVCDHTKLGVIEGRQAPLKIESLLDNATECIVLSTIPEDDVTSIEAEVGAFTNMCQQLVDDKRYEAKELALWMITAAGEKRIACSLATLRQKKRGKRMRRADAMLTSLRGDAPDSPSGATHTEEQPSTFRDPTNSLLPTQPVSVQPRGAQRVSVTD